MAHTVSQGKPARWLGQLVVIMTIVTTFIIVYTVLVRSSWTARPSTVEADPLGPSDDVEPVAPPEPARERRVGVEVNAPGHRF